MTSKHFILSADQIVDLAPGLGSCLATDMITVAGKKVGFMYRETPGNQVDSGWRFTAGCESQQYMDEPANLSIYDVNTIANYDREIIPYLNAPVGSAFERDKISGAFVSIDWKPE